MNKEIIRKRRYTYSTVLYILKKSAYKWSYTVPTCAFRGPAVPFCSNISSAIWLTLSPFSPPTEISAQHDLENEDSDSVPVSVPVHFGGIIGIVRHESKLLCLEVELWSKARKKSFIFLSVHDGVWSYKDRNNYFDLYLLQKHLNDFISCDLFTNLSIKAVVLWVQRLLRKIVGSFKKWILILRFLEPWRYYRSVGKIFAILQKSVKM